MEVIDAETGERIVIDLPKENQNECTSSSINDNRNTTLETQEDEEEDGTLTLNFSSIQEIDFGFNSTLSMLSSRLTNTAKNSTNEETLHQENTVTSITTRTAAKSSPSPTKKHKQPTMLFKETQSERPLGQRVEWEKNQTAKLEKARSKFRATLEGIRQEMLRKDLSQEEYRALEIEMMQKMKDQYWKQVKRLIDEEMEREIGREVESRLETSVIGRERLKKRHEQERTFYRSQIERVKEECEMSLTATLAQRNYLR